MNNGVKRGAKVWIAKIIEMIFLIFMALFAAIPLLQVLLNSFRTDREVKTMPLGLPKEWVFNNFAETWEIGGYATAYFNSLLTADGSYCSSADSCRVRSLCNEQASV